MGTLTYDLWEKQLNTYSIVSISLRLARGCIEYDEYVLPRVAIPVIIVYICMQKYIIKGMTYRPHGSCIRTAVPQKRDSDWR